MAFRAGDVVAHGPSGEEWVLACDEEAGRVCPAGWPNSMADARDCTLVERASDHARIEMLRQASALNDNRGEAARRALAAERAGK